MAGIVNKVFCVLVLASNPVVFLGELKPLVYVRTKVAASHL